MGGEAVNKLWFWLKKLTDPTLDGSEEDFILAADDPSAPTGEHRSRQLKGAVQSARRLRERIDRLLAAGGKPEEVDKAGDLQSALQENLERVKTLFRVPANADLIIREFILATRPPVAGAIVYMEGLADKTTINDNILLPLMLHARLDPHPSGRDGKAGQNGPDLQTINSRLLPGHQTAELHDLAKAAEHVLMGDTVLFVDGRATALAIETKGFPFRSIGKAENEPVVRGPNDAFTEPFRPNVALVRRRLKDPRLVTELLQVGRISSTNVALLYIDGICNPALIEEIKRRVEALDIDHLPDSGNLNEFIEDSPTSLFPQSLATERPDRVAAYLTEGHLALFVDNSPFALILPISFWSLMHAPEDHYLRWPYGGWLRWLRFTALLTALVLPAFYIATINYHTEMLPTDLLLFLAATREPVPFPAILEVIFMDVAWELIREAGTRIPTLIGSTLGLVGGLILGQAAVEARLVSPILVVIIAITGLSSFAVPNYVTAYAVRTARFIFLAAAAFQGFFGLAVAFYIFTLYMAGVKSFGVPFLAPVAPRHPPLADVTMRKPVFTMERRPAYTAPGDLRRQAEIQRPWDNRSRYVNPTDETGIRGRGEGGEPGGTET
jgi:spore germination protein KA